MTNPEQHLMTKKKTLLKAKPFVAGAAALCVVMGTSYYYINSNHHAPASQSEVVAKAGMTLPALTHEQEVAALKKMELGQAEYTKLAALLDKREIRVVVMPVRSPAIFPEDKPKNVLISSGLHSEVRNLNTVYQPVTLVLDKAGLVTFTLTDTHKMEVPLQAQDSFGPVMLPPLNNPSSPVTIGVIAQ